jgi:hypothetical protein
MLPQIFLLLIIPLSIYGVYEYCKDLSQNKVKPNLSSWIIWTTTPFVSMIAALIDGTKFMEVIDLLFFAIRPFIVICFAVYLKRYYTESTKLDIICFAGAILGIAGLFFFRNSNLVIFIQLVVSFLALMPTIIKVWYSKTESESYKMFAIAILTPIIKLLTLNSISFQNSAFTFYIIFINTIIVSSILIKNSKLKNNSTFLDSESCSE